MITETDFDLKVGLSLRALREERGLERADVMKITNISSEILDGLEYGRRSLNIENLYMMAKLYGVTMEDIIDNFNNSMLSEGTEHSEDFHEREIFKAYLRSLTAEERDALLQIYQIVKKLRNPEENKQ